MPRPTVTGYVLVHQDGANAAALYGPFPTREEAARFAAANDLGPSIILPVWHQQALEL